MAEHKNDAATTARDRVLIVGAAGAVGTALAREIIKLKGPKSVIAVLRKTPLPTDLSEVGPRTLTHSNRGRVCLCAWCSG